jgi:hypothetical protein
MHTWPCKFLFHIGTLSAASINPYKNRLQLFKIKVSLFSKKRLVKHVLFILYMLGLKCKQCKNTENLSHGIQFGRGKAISRNIKNIIAIIIHESRTSLEMRY